MKFLKIAITLGAVVALGACGAQSARTGQGVYYGYSPSLFAYAAADRDFLTVVHGNPFAVPDLQFRDVVLAAMQGANDGPATHFTATPSATTRPEYRTVLLFNGPVSAGGVSVCAKLGELATVKGDQPIRMIAAFCVGERPYAVVEGWVSASDPTAPGLRQMIRQAVTELFPTRRLDQDGIDCRSPGC